MRTSTLLLVLAAAGCAGDLHYRGTVDYRTVPGYDAKRPADVAVLPPAGDLPPGTAEAIREALRAALNDRAYAAVRSTAVDADPGAFTPGGPNPVLQVLVSRWDTTALWGSGTVRVSAEVRLLGAGSTEVLYRAQAADVEVRASFVATEMEDRPRTVDQVAAELADVLLDRLPRKGDR